MFTLTSTRNTIPVYLSEFETLEEAQQQMCKECTGTIAECCENGMKNIQSSILNTYSTVKAGKDVYSWTINEEEETIPTELRLSAEVADVVTRVLEEMGASHQFDADTIIAAVEKVMGSDDKPRFAFASDEDTQEPGTCYWILLECSHQDKKYRPSFLVHARSASEAEKIAVEELIDMEKNRGLDITPNKVKVLCIGEDEGNSTVNTGYYRVTMSYTLNSGKERYTVAVVVNEYTPSNASYTASIDLRNRVESNFPGLAVTDLCIEDVEMVDPPTESDIDFDDEAIPDYLK